MKRMAAVAAALLATCPAIGQAPAAAVRPYQVPASFANVANAHSFFEFVRLAPAHKEVLQRNLFVCWPTNDLQLFWVYGQNDYRNIPSFVTTDTVLQLYHVLFDSTLRYAEENTLYPELVGLTNGMLSESLATYRGAPTPELKRAALKNAAYFAVAAQALGIKASLPAEGSAMAAREAALIQAHSGYTQSAIFPYKIDYSQFIVRGHYTRSARLQRYFRAMMWYGLVPFAATTNDEPPRPLPEQIRQGLLLTRSLYRANLIGAWQRIYEPTSLFVGEANALTPAAWKRLMDPVFGPNPSLADLADRGRFDRFVATLPKVLPPRIRSAKRGAGLPGTAVQLHFLGQRYIPDSEVLQRLSNDDRVFPAGLDAMAALGSARAPAILDSRPDLYNPKSWRGYGAERSRLVAQFAALPPATWKSNLYYGWLYALKALVEPVPAGYPSFMRKVPWQDKSLNTALASWTEIRHDTILYGTQSAAEQGDGEEPPFVPGYVEPNVAFYDRLLTLTRLTSEGLSARKLVSPIMLDGLRDFEELVTFLRSVSARELTNGKLSKKEHERIRHIEGELESLTENMLKSAGNYVALSEDDLDMALVADVHTGGSDALEEAVGHANLIAVVVPVEGKLYLARGAVFSYYEFRHPISDRMTDAAWRKVLKSGKAPAPPFWTRSFLVRQAVKEPGE